MKWDGHTHTPYCPHGNKDELHTYIEQAIALGFQRYSITEHAPLPASFTDPVPTQDSAMSRLDLDEYLQECNSLKKFYQPRIEIMIGLEVDYLLGLEKETRALLDEIGAQLDDSILSLHFLPVNGKWTCLDYSPDLFERELVTHFESVDHLYRFYYQVLQEAVTSDLGKYKPKRIGHLSLIEKFKKRFPGQSKEIWWFQVMTLLDHIKERGYQLDFNTAGLQKPLCQDIYPSAEILQEALKRGIPFVYGSDAHQAKDVGYHYSFFNL